MHFRRQFFFSFEVQIWGLFLQVRYVSFSSLDMYNKKQLNPINKKLQEESKISSLGISKNELNLVMDKLRCHQRFTEH